MNYVLEFHLTGLPKTTNGSHGNWRVKAAATKQWKQRVYQACWHRAPPVPLVKARITLVRCSSVEPDYDNLVISFKPIIDGLRQAKILVDDKRVNVGIPTYRYEKAKPKMGMIKIKVEAV